jgi:hypothetical protein
LVAEAAGLVIGLEVAGVDAGCVGVAAGDAEDIGDGSVVDEAPAVADPALG